MGKSINEIKQLLLLRSSELKKKQEEQQDHIEVLKISNEITKMENRQPIKCPICERKKREGEMGRYYTVVRMKDHIKRVHPENFMEIYSDQNKHRRCEECGKVLLLSNYEKHVENCREEKQGSKLAKEMNIAAGQRERREKIQIQIAGREQQNENILRLTGMNEDSEEREFENDELNASQATVKFQNKNLNQDLNSTKLAGKKSMTQESDEQIAEQLNDLDLSGQMKNQ